MDSATGRAILTLLMDMAETYQKTVIIVTHNAAIARCADAVLHLKDGKIEAMETNPRPLKVDEIQW